MAKSKVIVESVFLISLIIFAISLIPATYTTSSILLSGAAGNPSNTPDQITSPLAPISDGVSILSGIVTVLTGIFAIQRSRSETKRKEIDRDMQLREVEILKLEIALEKERKKNQPVTDEKHQKTRAIRKSAGASRKRK